MPNCIEKILKIKKPPLALNSQGKLQKGGS